MIAWIYQFIFFWIFYKIISALIHTRVHVSKAIENYTAKIKPDEACARIFLAYQTVETAWNTWTIAGHENKWLEPWLHVRPYFHDFFNTLDKEDLSVLKNDLSNPLLAKILLGIFSKESPLQLSDDEIKKAPYLLKLMYQHHQTLKINLLNGQWDVVKSHIKAMPLIERQMINWNKLIPDGADLSNTDLRAISFYERTLSGVNCHGSDLSLSHFRDITFRQCILTQAKWSKLSMQTAEGSCYHCHLDENGFKALKKGGYSIFRMSHFWGQFDCTSIHDVDLFGSIFKDTLYRPSFKNCQLAMVRFNQIVQPILSKQIYLSAHDTMKRIEGSILKLFASNSTKKQQKAKELAEEYHRAIDELSLRGSQPFDLSQQAWLLFLKDINAKHLLNALSITSGMQSLAKLFLPQRTQSVHRVQNTTGNTSTSTTKGRNVGVSVATVMDHQSKP